MADNRKCHRPQWVHFRFSPLLDTIFTSPHLTGRTVN